MAIGLDGADTGSLLRWTADGTMPGVATIRRQGAWWRIAPPPTRGRRGLGLLLDRRRTRATWSLLLQGIEPGSYDSPYKHPSCLKGEPFWSATARHGRRVGVIDVPTSALARMSGVVQVADGLCFESALAPSQLEPFLVEFELSIEHKREATEWLLAQGGWNLLVAVLQGSVLR